LHRQSGTRGKDAEENKFFQGGNTTQRAGNDPFPKKGGERDHGKELTLHLQKNERGGSRDKKPGEARENSLLVGSRKANQIFSPGGENAVVWEFH